MNKMTGLLMSMLWLGIVMVGPSGTANAAEPLTKEDKPKTAAELKKSIPKKHFDVAGRVWYELVNITIPSTSAHRQNESIDTPPQLFVVVKRDGKKMGETTDHTGWTVDLSTADANKFPIEIGTDSRYTLEVWDDDWPSCDEHILNITQLKGEAFEGLVIYEQGNSFAPKEQLLKLTWKRVVPPKKYRVTKTPPK